MGVNRRSPDRMADARCPHARGGEPLGAAVVPTRRRCPHAHGGEPRAVVAPLWASLVVPTHVGVNRWTHVARLTVVVPTHVGVNRQRGALEVQVRVVPTHVGVNRQHCVASVGA